MDFKKLAVKLSSIGCSSSEILKVIEDVMLNIKAFEFAHESLDRLELYVVIRNKGDYKLFKTIDGFIVMDRLDNSYVYSRELVGVGGWNVNASFRLYFTDNRLNVEKITLKELHKVLFHVVEPTTIKYVLGLKNNEQPTTLLVDIETYNNLDYPLLRDCIRSSYERSLNIKRGIENVPECFVVGYSLDEAMG